MLDALGWQPIAWTQQWIHTFWTEQYLKKKKKFKQWLILKNWRDLTHVIRISASFGKHGKT